MLKPEGVCLCLCVCMWLSSGSGGALQAAVGGGGGAYYSLNLLHRLCRKECVGTEPMSLCCVFELLCLPCLCCVIAATSCCLVGCAVRSQ